MPSTLASHSFHSSSSSSARSRARVRNSARARARARPRASASARRRRRELVLDLVVFTVAFDVDVSNATTSSDHDLPSTTTSNSDVRRAIERARRARDDVATCARVARDALGANAPSRALYDVLRASNAIENFERDSRAIDRVVTPRGLDESEREAWRAVRADRLGVPASDVDDGGAYDDLTGERRGVRLPFVRNTNDVVCAVFSCVNDPRAPPGAESALALRLARDGVNMGLRGDRRITSEGLMYSFEDVLEKLDAYLALIDEEIGW